MGIMWNALKKMVVKKDNLPELKAHYEANGFLVLKNFFSHEELAAFDTDVHNIWENRQSNGGEITIDVLEGELVGQRLKLKDAPDSALNCAHKVNDLYLESGACRNLNLNKKLCSILKDLFNDDPLVINSLSFRKGSQQPHHFDTYFMPPPVQNQMVVSSICLEDQSSEAGPLSYYPGSHKIEPFVFSHGGIHLAPGEMKNATAYVEEEIAKRELTTETFIGNAGDVFIWHAQLYHGGLPIQDENKTRKTLVTHYWRRNDVDADRVALTPEGESYLKKDHHKVAA